MPRLERNPNAPDPQKNVSPEEAQLQFAQELAEAQFATADAAERCAYLFELIAVKMGHLQLDDCEYYPDRRDADA